VRSIARTALTHGWLSRYKRNYGVHREMPEQLFNVALDAVVSRYLLKIAGRQYRRSRSHEVPEVRERDAQYRLVSRLLLAMSKVRSRGEGRRQAMIDHIEVWDAINKGEMRCRKCGYITWLVPWMLARSRCPEFKKLCPKCGSEMRVMRNRAYGRFWQCRKCNPGWQMGPKYREEKVGGDPSVH
jgi:predicted RNA-binding Zn-ribbon protein involved in translation (DUF1610 family)